MSQETYQIVRWIIQGAIVALAAGAVFLYHRFRRPLTLLSFITLFFASFVFIKSAIFPFWCSYIGTLPFHEEGMAIAILHLFVIGPMAAITLLLSIFQPAIRWIGISLSLGFVVFSPILFLFI